MRTARALVARAPNDRPRSQRTIEQAEAALDRLAEGMQRLSPLRFRGYEQRTDLTPGTRCAVYEADYPD